MEAKYCTVKCRHVIEQLLAGLLLAAPKSWNIYQALLSPLKI